MTSGNEVSSWPLIFVYCRRKCWRLNKAIPFMQLSVVIHSAQEDPFISSFVYWFKKVLQNSCLFASNGERYVMSVNTPLIFWSVQAFYTAQKSERLRWRSCLSIHPSIRPPARPSVYLWLGTSDGTVYWLVLEFCVPFHYIKTAKATRVSWDWPQWNFKPYFRRKLISIHTVCIRGPR